MAIEGKRIISKATKAEGTIVKVENGKLFISLESTGSIPIDLKKYQDIILVDDETKEELDSIISSSAIQRSEKTVGKAVKHEIFPKSLDILDAEGEDIYFRINIDVLNICFGANVKMYMKATYPSSHDIAVKGNDNEAYVWMPKCLTP